MPAKFYIIPPSALPLTNATANIARHIQNESNRHRTQAAFKGMQRYRTYLKTALLEPPTPYTLKGVQYIAAGKRAIIAHQRGWIKQPDPAVVITPKQFAYLRYQFTGGVRTPNPTKRTERHGLPIGLGKRDRFGNIKGLSSLASRFAQVKAGSTASSLTGKSLFTRPTAKGGALIGFADSVARVLFVAVAKYRPRLKWRSVIEGTIAKKLNKPDASANARLERAIRSRAAELDTSGFDERDIF